MRPLLEGVPVVPVHLGGVDVGRALDVGLGEHGHHGQQNLEEPLFHLNSRMINHRLFIHNFLESH